MTTDELKALVRSVPDFPAPGVLFRDITTLISHGDGLRAAVGHLADRARAGGITTQRMLASPALRPLLPTLASTRESPP